VLPNLRIASPCSANWDRMIGDERVRYCPECKLNVYNFSAMPEHEIRRLVAKREGRLCARWYRKTDGTVLTADCPVGFRARVGRISLVAGTALSAFMGVGTAKAQQKGDTSSPSTSASLVQIDKARQAKGTILVRVVDASGAVIPNAKISVVNPAGNIVAQGSTNFEGEFQVTGLSNSPYTVQAESLGFKRTEMKDIIPSASTIPVQMTVDMATMGVIVTVDPEVPVTHDETAVQDSLPLALEPAPKQNFMRRLFSRVSSSAK
jgi:Carboxypeptidase regulatory-like domain